MSLREWIEASNAKILERQNMTTKESNPKDVVGCKKPPLSTVSCPVFFEMGLGMQDGTKYGRHNYREVGVRSSIYYDAAMRHLMAWWEGEDIDPDSGLHHVSKTLSCLAVLRDAQMNDLVDDDRPPRPKAGWMGRAQEHMDRLLERNPNPPPPFTEVRRQARPMEEAKPGFIQEAVRKAIGDVRDIVRKGPTDKELHDDS